MYVINKCILQSHVESISAKVSKVWPTTSNFDMSKACAMKPRKTIDLEQKNLGRVHLFSFTGFQSLAQNSCFLIIIKEIACDNKLLLLPYLQQFLSEHFVICVSHLPSYSGAHRSTEYTKWESFSSKKNGNKQQLITTDVSRTSLKIWSLTGAVLCYFCIFPYLKCCDWSFLYHSQKRSTQTFLTAVLSTVSIMHVGTWLALVHRADIIQGKEVILGFKF